MVEVSKETKEVLKWLRTELMASHAIFSPPSDYKNGYNDGLSKAVRFLDSYAEGRGLFQINLRKIDAKEKNT